MDAESIKLIADTLNTLSGDAKTMFIWWLVVRHMLAYVIGGAALACIYVTVNRVIRSVTMMYRIMDAMGWGHLDEERRTRVVQFVRANREQIREQIR